MKTIQTAVLAGAAAVLLSSAFGIAAAKSPSGHTLTIRLPGGGIEQIRYEGDVAPEVVVGRDGWARESLGWPAAFFGASSPFAQMERISAEMDRQMAIMLANADALAVNPGWITQVDARKLPGTESYSFVSTMSGSGVCGRSVEITSTGNGQKPHVISHSYGNCGNGHASAGAPIRAPAEDQPSNVREIRDAPPASEPVLREASAVE